MSAPPQIAKKPTIANDMGFAQFDAAIAAVLTDF
jgi:hypothetical protein